MKRANVLLGCDPEGFLVRDGKVVGAEKYIPQAGVKSSFKYGAVVLDGIQFEIHTNPQRTPMGVANEVREAIVSLKRHLSRVPDVQISMASVVDITREELDSLAEKSRILGCEPSFNLYGFPGIGVDGRTYLKRSGGGHVQLGLSKPIYQEDSDVDNRTDLVALLEVVLGNTCVLVDRDANAPERRKNYGRASEYRTPDHGLEYRTLSNFWLQSQPLTCLVFELATIAASILEESLVSESSLDVELMEACDLTVVKQAIQENDFNQAYQTWEKFRRFIEKHIPEGGLEGFGMNGAVIPRFERFIEGVQKDGLQKFFPGDPVAHWSQKKRQGWDEFIQSV